MSTYSGSGFLVEEYICFSNREIKFHQGEESVLSEETFGHSAFDKIVEYDIFDIDKMIEVLEKHYEEKQCSESLGIENLDMKLKKLLNLVFSFYSGKTIISFDVEETQGYRATEVKYTTLSHLKSYFDHFGIKAITDYCM